MKGDIIPRSVRRAEDNKKDKRERHEKSIWLPHDKALFELSHAQKSKRETPADVDYWRVVRGSEELCRGVLHDVVTGCSLTRQSLPLAGFIKYCLSNEDNLNVNIIYGKKSESSEYALHPKTKWAD